MPKWQSMQVSSKRSRHSAECFLVAERSAIRGEDAVETGEVQPGPGNQRGETSYEVQWIEDDMRGAVAERLFELVDDLPAFVG